MGYGRRILGDCLDEMGKLEAESVDSIVTDPPYGLNFMGKGWDHGVPGIPFWEAALRVAKPGAFLLAFGGTRTFHRLAVAIEDAGWEIRDTIMWVYGSGFPKSLDVSKAIDKAAGKERAVIGQGKGRTGKAVKDHTGLHDDDNYELPGDFDITAPATDAARQWEGWGTALKPAWEPIIVARKPIIGTVAANVLKFGTGAINIDGCRVGDSKNVPASPSRALGNVLSGSKDGSLRNETGEEDGHNPNVGRWPANLIHDGSEEVMELFPQSKSCNSPSSAKPESKFRPSQGNYQPQGKLYPGDNGSAARFFYCAKTSRSERGEGNNHPTVKPISLIEYCIKLATQPGGTVLDPFAGSFSTALAAINLEMKYICIEKEEAYFKIGSDRIKNHLIKLGKLEG